MEDEESDEESMGSTEGEGEVGDGKSVVQSKSVDHGGLRIDSKKER